MKQHSKHHEQHSKHYEATY